jgi:ABC-type Fe3+ transport system permease subunit
MKEILKSTFVYFLIGSTVTGSVYHLLNYTSNQELTDALLYNLILVVIAFIFSFLGYKFQKNKK